MGRGTLGAFGGVALAGVGILALAGEARAQRVAFDAASSAAGTGSSLQLAHTVGTAPDRYLVVAVAVTPSGAAITSVTFGGQALGRIGGRAASTCRSELWGLAAPPSGTRMVQVNLSVGSSLVVGASSYAAVDPRDPIGPFASHTGNDPAPVALSTSVAIDAGDYTVDVLCGYSSGGAPTPAAGADQTQRWRRSTGNTTGVGSTQQNNSAGRATMSWTLTGSGNIDWSIATTPLKPTPLPPDAAPDVMPDLAPDVAPDAPDDAADLGADAPEGDAAEDLAAPVDGGVHPDTGEPDAAPDGEAPPATAEYRLRVGCACRGGGPGSGGGLPGVLVAFAYLMVRRSRSSRGRSQ